MNVLTKASSAGSDDETKQALEAKPVSSTASLAEAGARLKLDHDEFAASLERIRDFAVADDADLLQGEWTHLESITLQHMDAEEMLLLPKFVSEEPTNGRTLLAEHAILREQLGEIGISVDLHTVRLSAIEHLYRTMASHMAREVRTLYPWAALDRNRPLLDALARRSHRASQDTSREGQATATLLTLLRVCRDGEQGYRRAVQDVSDEESRAVLGRLAEERARSARTLRDELRRLGVNAQLKGTALGTLHRSWIDTSSRGHNSLRAVLRECERGEELALRAYRVALRTELPHVVRGYIDTQHGEVQRALEEVRTLSATR